MPTETLEVTQEEKDARGSATLAAIVQNLLVQDRETQLTAFAEELRGLQEPKREVADEIFGDKERIRVPAGSTLRTRGTRDYLYARMSEEDQEVRDPDTDHWNAEWIRGDFNKNHAQKLLAEEKIRGLHPNLYRADSLEGAAGAAGAISAGSQGDFIPRPLENAILIARDRVAKMRRFANNLVMTRQTHTIPTAAAMVGFMQGESTTPTTTGFTASTVVLTAQKGQVMAVASLEILDDAAINLVSVYTELHVNRRHL